MSPMKYFCADLTLELKQRAEKELGETEEIRTKCLDELKQLITEEPDFYPCTEDVFLLKFLRQHKFKVKKAFKKLKDYYKCRARYSGIFTEFRPSHYKHLLDTCNSTVLEFRDQDDVGICVARVGQYDIDKYSCNEILGCLAIGVDIFLQVEATQVTGYIIICDFSDFSLRHAQHFVSFRNLYRIAAVQDLIPCRVKAYHVINEPFYIHSAITLLQKFLPKTIRNRFHFHGSDLDSLHQQVSPDILPQELGGKQGPLAEFAKQSNSIILNHEDYINEMNKYGYKGKTLHQLKKQLF